MRASIQELKAVGFEKNELEFQVMSELKTILPLPAHQNSNPYVEIIL